MVLHYLQMSLGRHVGNWAQKNGHLHGAMVQAMIPGSEFLFVSTTGSHSLMILFREIWVEKFIGVFLV